MYSPAGSQLGLLCPVGSFCTGNQITEAPPGYFTPLTTGTAFAQPCGTGMYCPGQLAAPCPSSQGVTCPPLSVRPVPAACRESWPQRSLGRIGAIAFREDAVISVGIADAGALTLSQSTGAGSGPPTNFGLPISPDTVFLAAIEGTPRIAIIAQGADAVFLLVFDTAQQQLLSQRLIASAQQRLAGPAASCTNRATPWQDMTLCSLSSFELLSPQYAGNPVTCVVPSVTVISDESTQRCSCTCTSCSCPDPGAAISLSVSITYPAPAYPFAAVLCRLRGQPCAQACVQPSFTTMQRNGSTLVLGVSDPQMLLYRYTVSTTSLAAGYQACSSVADPGTNTLAFPCLGMIGYGIVNIYRSDGFVIRLILSGTTFSHTVIQPNSIPFLLPTAVASPSTTVRTYAEPGLGRRSRMLDD
jgi:hypothetical protein